MSDTSRQGDIPAQQPRIYFGELIDDYAIVGGNPGAPAREFDGRPENYTYQGKGGVPLGSWAKRLIFASYYGERNILFNQAIGPDSRIIYNQQPRERVKKVAPWLTVDGDPYPAVVNGRIEWIVDGYTTLGRLPLLRAPSLRKATADTLTGAARCRPTQVNYIRNSVKAVVDAYDGTVKLYRGTRGPGAQDVDEGLPRHRQAQERRSATGCWSTCATRSTCSRCSATCCTRYHVTDAQAFYSDDQRWKVPEDPTAPTSNALQPPYYLSTARPGEDTPKFSVTSVYLPNSRQNLAAFVSVNSEATDSETTARCRSCSCPANADHGPEPDRQRRSRPTRACRRRCCSSSPRRDDPYGNLLDRPGRQRLAVRPTGLHQAQRDRGILSGAQFVIASFGKRRRLRRRPSTRLSRALRLEEGVARPTTGTPQPTTEPGVRGGLPRHCSMTRRAAIDDAAEALKDGDLATYQSKINQMAPTIEAAQSRRGRGQRRSRAGGPRI